MPPIVTAGRHTLASLPLAQLRPSALLRLAATEIGAVAALAVLAFGGWAFLSIADEVGEGETHAFDRAVLLALRVRDDPSVPLGPGWLAYGARDFTSIGSVTQLAFLVLIVCALFLSLRRRAEAVGLLVASGGGLAISQGLKRVWDRPRPPIEWHATDSLNASFPSGHAMLSAVVFLTLGALVARFAQRRRVKVFAMSAAVLATVLVGLSRLYLGVHWPTDVLAGWSVGAAWAMTCWLVGWSWRRRFARIRAKEQAEDLGA